MNLRRDWKYELTVEDMRGKEHVVLRAFDKYNGLFSIVPMAPEFFDDAGLEHAINAAHNHVASMLGHDE
jgi:hypothetical protein